MPLIKINFTPKLSREEKQLASLIENFSFPNDRESILEALVFAKEKIDFISSEKVDRKSVNFGYLPEERGVYPKVKIYDQLMYFAELKGMKRSEGNKYLPYPGIPMEKEYHSLYYNTKKKREYSLPFQAND